MANVPMLLTPFTEGKFKRYPKWYASEKYDGFRMEYFQDENKFYSKNHNEFDLPASFYREMKTLGLPKGTVLDGELWLDHYGAFNDIANAIAVSSDDLVYKVIDVTSVKGEFETSRLPALKRLISRKGNKIRRVSHHAVTSMEQVNRMLEEVLARGGEGLCLRPPHQIYEYNIRCHEFMKLKKFETTEAVVVSHNITDAADKDADLDPDYVSSLSCYLIEDERKAEFKMNWRGTNPPDVGEIIVVKFSQYTANGLPKFPVYVGIRDERDQTEEMKKHARRNPDAKKKVVKKLQSIDVMRGCTPDRLKTEADWKDTADFVLKLGESVWMKGSSGTYKITAPKNGAKLYCSCPSWKYQKLPPAIRSCKHTKALQHLVDN
jgi:DNA ligase-1